MFVICPKCGAKYQIPSEISLNYGQKMQCSACGHYFVLNQENSFQKNESEKEQIIPPKISEISHQKQFEPLATIPSQEKRREAPAVLPEVFQPSVGAIKRTSSLLLPFLLVVVSLFILLILLGLAWQYREEMQFQNKIEAWRLNRTLPLRVEVQEAEKLAPVVSDLPPVVKPEEKHPQKKQEEVQKEGGEEISQPLVPSEENIEPPFVPVAPPEESMDQPSVFEGESNFSFRSLRFHLLNGEIGPAVQIEGIIKNDQDYPMTLPQVVYVKAYDTHGQVLFQKEIYFNKQQLMPHQEQAFFGTYSPAPKEIKWIDASFQK